MPSFSFLAGSALLTVNVLLFLLMGWDKRRAKQKQYRIAERTLLLLGLAGGGLGGLLGMQLFRHKTRHPYFYIVYGIGTLIGFTSFAFL